MDIRKNATSAPRMLGSVNRSKPASVTPSQSSKKLTVTRNRITSKLSAQEQRFGYSAKIRSNHAVDEGEGAGANRDRKPSVTQAQNTWELIKSSLIFDSKLTFIIRL